ncbi:hypothetical protein [Pontibacillus marinus]|uniref:Uncharacterized protein n=1 Tax=Pontibacillus marinus BH030004 = DSM 16465 TaxID=1385511 RepID=A0A0A5G9I7_9BACI|nr:hypothetical protein [Pontibacillus marinus]KGX89816.1 hypothetical protein N783_04145 [Pontibacillus marinus BH030004 = DSM 16465]
MLKKIRRNLVWIVPIIIITTIVLGLFWSNLTLIAKQPSDEWSRHIKIGETQTNRTPFSYQNGSEVRVAFFNEGKIFTKTYNQSFELLHGSSKSVPFTKWDPFYYNKGELIYHEDGEIINGETDEFITMADKFYPLEDHLFYSKDHEIYQLNPKSKSSTLLGRISDEYETIVPIVHNNKKYFMAYKSLGFKVPMALYEALPSGELTVKTKDMLKVPISEYFKDISVATKDEGFGIVAKTENDRNEHRLYILESSWDRPSLEFNLLNLKDPNTGRNLKEAGDFRPYYRYGQLHVIFHATGFTERATETMSANNIYQFSKTDSGIDVQQISNTRYFSTNPLLLNKETIMWLDYGIKKKIFISSKNPKLIEKADRFTQTDLTIALGQTVMHLVKSFTSIYLAYPWIVVPLLFFSILFLFFKRSMDQNLPWVLYSGIVVYIIGALLLEEHFFVRTIQARAPDFVTFTGFPYVFILLFGLLALFCLMFVRRTWSVGYKVMYFVGLHIIFLMLTIGGYIL